MAAVHALIASSCWSTGCVGLSFLTHDGKKSPGVHGFLLPLFRVTPPAV